MTSSGVFYFTYLVCVIFWKMFHFVGFYDLHQQYFMTKAQLSQQMYLLQDKYPERMKLFLYFCIGISAATIDMGVFIVLYNFYSVGELTANVISTLLAVVYAFTMNVRFNFRVTSHLAKRFVSYFSVNLVGLGISFVALYLFTTQAGYDANLVKAATLPVIFLVQFLLNRMITFHKNFFVKK